MALKAGIPLAGLTSESRAAIFYAKSPAVSFANEISRGAIVFDLGSSTLDFTYLSDTDKPIDYGYDLGASIIDKTIFNTMIKSNEKIQEFLSKYPEYEGSLPIIDEMLIFSPPLLKLNAFPINDITLSRG